MAKVSFKTPKGKGFEIEAGFRPKTREELNAGTDRMMVKHETKRVKSGFRSHAIRTSAKATAAGSIGNTAVSDAYELMRGGINEDEDANVVGPNTNPNPTPDPEDRNSKGSKGSSGRI